MAKKLFSFGPKTVIQSSFDLGDPTYEVEERGVWFVDEENEGLYLKNQNSRWVKRLEFEEVEENLDAGEQ